MAEASTAQARAPLDVSAVLKECAFISLVMFALCVGLVAYYARDVPGGLELASRWTSVFIVIGITFFGRLSMIMMREGRPFPALVIVAPVSVAMLVLVIGVEAADEDKVAAFEAYLPFGDKVVNWILAIIATVFTLRAVWALRHTGVSAKTAADREAAMDAFSAKVQRAARLLGPVLLVVAVIFPMLTYAPEMAFLPKVDRRLLDIAILVVTYIMLGWGLNIVVGLAGLLDLGYVAFYAVGAYSYALLATEFGVGFWICLPFAGIMAATAGIILGFPVLRLRGDYLAIVTLGFGEMIRVILLNWYEFTNGPDGISGIPRPSFFGLPFVRSAPEGVDTFHSVFGLTYSPVDRIVFLYYLILALALITNVFTMRIRKLPVGRAWEALREDEIACRSLGI